MSKNYNGGRRNNGVGSTGNNGQYSNMIVDPHEFVTDSNDVKSYEIRTIDVQNYLQKIAKVLDRAIEKKLGKAEGEINTKVQVMSINFSGNKEKQPFVPFMLMVSGNIIDMRDVDPDIPSVLKPDMDNGVHLNSVYYNQMFAPYMFSKDDVKSLNSPSYRRAMHINLPFSTLNALKRYMKPKVEFSGNSDDINNAQVVVLIDPIRVFHKLAFESDNPHLRYYVVVKELKQIDDLNFKYTVERKLKQNNKEGLQNIEALKRFLASGNRGIR